MKYLFSTLITFLIFTVFTSSKAQTTHTWSYSFGSNGSDRGMQVAVNFNKEIYLLGRFTGSVDFGTAGSPYILAGAGLGDISLTKYTSDGELINVMHIGGDGDDIATEMLFDIDSNIYLCGAFESTTDFDPGSGTAIHISNGSYDAFVTKYDSQGNYIWAFTIGGGDYEQCVDIVTDINANIYISGLFYGTVDFDPGPNEYLITAPSIDYGGNFIAKYGPDGSLIYAKAIGGGNSELIASEIEVDSSGNLYLTGGYTDTADFDPGPDEAVLTASYYDLFFAKYDPDGNYLFAKSIGNGDEVTSSSLTMDHEKNFYFTGYFYGPTDFDAGDNEFILNTAGNRETFIAKYDADGEFINAIALEGSENSYGWGFSIVTDVNDNLYVLGKFNDDVDFDPGNDLAVLSAGTFPDALYLALYNTDLQYRDAIAIPGSDFGISASCALDPDGNIYITGLFNDEADFDPGPGESILASNGYDDIFLAKYSQGVLNTIAPQAGTDEDLLRLSPNPTSGILYLETNAALTDASLRVVSAAGQVWHEKKGLFGNHLTLDLSGLPAGVYTVQVAGGSFIQQRKVVISR